MEKFAELFNVIKELLSPINSTLDSHSAELKELWGEVEKLRRKDDKQDIAISQMVNSINTLTNGIKWFIVTITGIALTYYFPKVLDFLSSL